MAGANGRRCRALLALYGYCFATETNVLKISPRCDQHGIAVRSGVYSALDRRRIRWHTDRRRITPIGKHWRKNERPNQQRITKRTLAYDGVTIFHQYPLHSWI